MREIFGIPEAAEMLGVHPVTLRGWIRDGRVEGVKYSSVWRVEGSELRRVRREGVPKAAVKGAETE